LKLTKSVAATIKTRKAIELEKFFFLLIEEEAAFAAGVLAVGLHILVDDVDVLKRCMRVL
jgi:hypothetical protein